MAPLPPSTTSTYYSHLSSLRQRQGERAGGGRGGGARKPPPPPQRSASFHERTAPTAAFPVEHRQMRRPMTQPDLLAGGRRETTASGGASPDPKRQGGDMIFGAVERRMPAKVLVNVTVQRSLGPVQVMASTEWSIQDLMAAAAMQYAKEGRRPPLPTTDPSALGLHYSQFSLESLDPKEKLSGLGSRNFFLCPKSVPGNSDPASASSSSPSAVSSSSSSSSSCAEEAHRACKISIPWHRFMAFFLQLD